MLTIFILAYAASCVSGFIAGVKFMTQPTWNRSWQRVESGVDVSLCDLPFMVFMAIFPIANLSSNALWLKIWWERRKLRIRPLAKPARPLRTRKERQCPILFKGKFND